MNFNNLNEFIDFLEKRDELKRITTTVDSNLEITEIVDRVFKSSGPALLFENVTGSDFPLLINLFGTEQRMCWGLGVENPTELVNKIKILLSNVENPPKTISDKINLLKNLFSLRVVLPKSTKHAECQEVIYKDNDVDLYKFPLMTCWPEDAGPFITMPLVFTRDPITNIRNVGTYRMQVYDKNTTGMHWQTHKVGKSHMAKAKEAGKRYIDVSVAIGADPATMWTGSAPLPPQIDEMMLAGFLKDTNVKMVKCITNNLEVPASSEIILEGYVDTEEMRDEGPFGDHTGYYSGKEPYPVFHVKAITHKKNPTYISTIVGIPPKEDYVMGSMTGKLFLPIIQMAIPEIRDMKMPAEGIFHNLVIVSIKKSYPGQAYKVMYALWGLGLLSLAKIIIVVDEDVDLNNSSELLWRVTNNIAPDRDVITLKGPTDDLDHTMTSFAFGGKLGIDATRKIEGESGLKKWPNDIILSQEIKDLVTNKWETYGLE